MPGFCVLDEPISLERQTTSMASSHLSNVKGKICRTVNTAYFCSLESPAIDFSQVFLFLYLFPSDPGSLMNLVLNGNVGDVSLSTVMYGEVDQNMSLCSNLLLRDPSRQGKVVLAYLPFRLARRSLNRSRACTLKRCLPLLVRVESKFVKYSAFSVLEAIFRSSCLTIGRCFVARDLDLERSSALKLEPFKTGPTTLSFVPIAKSCRSGSSATTRGVKRISINRLPLIARQIGGI